jgi:hypothetical protein
MTCLDCGLVVSLLLKDLKQFCTIQTNAARKTHCVIWNPSCIFGNVGDQISSGLQFFLRCLLYVVYLPTLPVACTGGGQQPDGV